MTRELSLNVDKISSFEEYRELASRTLTDLGSPRKNFLHMDAGISGEFLGEAIDILKKTFAYKKQFDKVHFGEELADTMWYIAGMFTLNKLSMDSQFEDQLKLRVDELENADEIQMLNSVETEEERIETILGFMVQNKHIVTCADINALVALTALTMKICDTLEIDFWQALTNNIAKLKVRYPEKFTNENAIVRDLKAERAELEK